MLYDCDDISYYLVIAQPICFKITFIVNELLERCNFVSLDMNSLKTSLFLA